MPTKKFSIEPGGPKRLVVSWGFAWKNFVVRLDDEEVGRIDGGFQAVREGATFALRDGRALRAQVVMQKSWAGNMPELHLYLDGTAVPGSEAVPLPAWGYAFAGACAVIPLVTLGGAVPAMIGFGGAGACAALARDTSRSVAMRIGFCLGVTALAWGLLGAFVMILAK